MYQMRYEDIVEESTTSAREHEGILFDRCIDFLQKAKQVGPGTKAALDAVVFTRRLWIVLIEDLGLAENALPQDVKASLISIGFFVLKEMEKLEGGNKIDFDAVIEVSQSIRNGLDA